MANKPFLPSSHDRTILPSPRGHYDLLPIRRRVTKLLEVMGKITFNNIGASPDMELDTKFGVEKHLFMALD